MTQSVVLPWGTSSLEVRLPSDWRILGELIPKHVPPPDDVEAACAEALANPIGTSRMADRNLSGRNVVLVVDDHSRPTPVRDFIMPVVRELEQAGVKDSDIRGLIATGVHRPSTVAEIEHKVGTEAGGRFTWQCHDPYTPEGLVDLGMTTRGTRVVLNKLLADADLIVCLGSLEPHLLLGFGGGYKMLIPGCAGVDTVGTNHLQGVDGELFDYVGIHGEQSPMRLDLEEGASMLGKDVFIVNAAINETARPTRFFCGDPVKAHRIGEAFVEDAVSLPVEEPADVVITNSFPMDIDLRQSIKCVGNCLNASKPGGAMLGFLKCEQGLGEIPLAKATLPYPLMRTILGLIGSKRILPLVKRVKKDEPVEEVFIGHFGLQMLRRNHLAIYSDSTNLPEDIGRKMGLARSYTNIDEMIAWAAGKVPKNPSVWVFPYGGATYARIV